MKVVVMLVVVNRLIFTQWRDLVVVLMMQLLRLDPKFMTNHHLVSALFHWNTTLISDIGTLQESFQHLTMLTCTKGQAVSH